MRGRVLAMGAVLVAVGMASPAAAAAGPWVWPLDGPHTVGRPFEPPTTPYGPGHRGADLPGRPGQLVHAAGSGRISYAGLLAGRGVLVVVHADGLRTTYEPVTALVGVGRLVAAGDVIGRLDAGHPGCSPACLHWGLLRGATYLDPVSLVRRGPSRLLPVDDAAAPTAAPASVLDVSPVSGAAAAASPAPAPRPAAEPDFALRSDQVATGGAALLALVVGLLLLRRQPQPPPRPATPAFRGGGLRQPPVPAVHDPQPARLVDLTSERHRRRPEVA